MRRYGALVLAGLLLAGCGGGGGSKYDDAKSVARAAGCVSYQTAPMNPGAADTGECHYRGHLVGVDWFKDDAGMKTFRQMSDAVGGAVILYGANWALSCYGAKADCDALKKRVGGSLG